MTTAFLTRASLTVALAAVVRRGCGATFSRHICKKGHHLGRTTTIRTMGVGASCRSGGGDSDGGEADSNLNSPRESSGNMMEAVVCREDELPEEGMKSFDVEGGQVLVVRHKGKLSAIGSKCSHYGAPLEKGALCEGRVRCPWHGACFSLETGDIEDFPGLDSIPKYDVEVVDGSVKVMASQEHFGAAKRVKPLAKRDENNNTSFVVIGGGAAGATCVERLRQEGFTGRLVMVTRENHLPYDRPKLSKAMHLTPDNITLRSNQFYESGDIEIKLGVTAEGLDAENKVVKLSNGEELTYDKVFIATGGKPRQLSNPGADLKGIFVVRTPEDANAVAAAAAGKRVAIIGTSFIGMEAAAYLSSEDRAASVTVVGNTEVPFERSLGRAVGERIQKLFEENGVKFANKVNVKEFIGEDGQVKEVVLDNDETIPADVVVMGVGVVPDTQFLSTSSVRLDERGFVPVNEHLETNIADVYCGGDIASFPLFLHDGEKVAIGHWQVAHGHGSTAALNMLGKATPVKSVPFFWTVLYGKSLRYTGHGMYDDILIGGDLENLAFIAYYCKGDRVVALASLGKDPAAAKYAEMLNNGDFLTREKVIEDGEVACKL
ncbi:apoptosis-inducing factor 3 isoform X2 [Penaeus vannamei]|uniref:apoptosis-inducing factor 3 isoform X2 n=2 Tax=Penaeus vannamei TaxID=6689 RepID=UPI00387F3B43